MHSKVDNGSFGQGLTVLRHATDLNLLLGICGLKRTSTAQDFLGRSSRVPCIGFATCFDLPCQALSTHIVLFTCQVCIRLYDHTTPCAWSV